MLIRVVVFVAASVCLAFTRPVLSQDPGSEEPVVGGPVIEDFEFEVETISGKRLTQEDVRDKVVLIDFWGTWCPPCRRAIPHLVRLDAKYRDQGLVILGLNYEKIADTAKAEERVRQFAERNGIKYPLALGTAEIRAQIPDFAGYPTMLLFRKGLEFDHLEVGFTEDHATRLEKWIQQELAKKAKKKKALALNRRFTAVDGTQFTVGDGTHYTLFVCVHPKARPTASILDKLRALAAKHADKLALHVVTRADIEAGAGTLQLTAKDLAPLYLGKAFPAWALYAPSGRREARDAGASARIWTGLLQRVEGALRKGGAPKPDDKKSGSAKKGKKGKN